MCLEIPNKFIIVIIIINNNNIIYYYYYIISRSRILSTFSSGKSSLTPIVVNHCSILVREGKNNPIAIHNHGFRGLQHLQTL